MIHPVLSVSKVPCGGIYPPGFDSSTQVLTFFLEFISGFNRHYSLNGMTRVHRQRGVNDDFINLEDLSNQLFGCAHRDTVASVCS
jgi:hypothetical protein